MGPAVHCMRSFQIQYFFKSKIPLIMLRKGKNNRVYFRLHTTSYNIKIFSWEQWIKDPVPCSPHWHGSTDVHFSEQSGEFRTVSVGNYPANTGFKLGFIFSAYEKAGTSRQLWVVLWLRSVSGETPVFEAFSSSCSYSKRERRWEENS